MIRRISISAPTVHAGRFAWWRSGDRSQLWTVQVCLCSQDELHGELNRPCAAGEWWRLSDGWLLTNQQFDAMMAPWRCLRDRTRAGGAPANRAWAAAGTFVLVTQPRGTSGWYGGGRKGCRSRMDAAWTLLFWILRFNVSAASFQLKIGKVGTWGFACFHTTELVMLLQRKGPNFNYAFEFDLCESLEKASKKWE
jgi:hypothetical protein